MPQLLSPQALSQDWADISESRPRSLSAMSSAFQAVDWTEVLGLDVPEWLVPGLLQKSSLHVLSSHSGCYKTWLALSLALSGIYGLPVLGQQPSRGFSTLYLAADSTFWDINQQLTKLLTAHRLLGSRPPEHSTFTLMPMGFLFDNEAHVKLLAQYCHDWDIDTFVVDVLLYAHMGDENDNGQMARTVLRAAKQLRDELGLAILFLHHSSKPRPDMPETARGAGTIIQAAEHHLTLARRSAGEDLVTLKCRKIRGDRILPTEGLRFTLAEVNGGRVLDLVRPDNASPADHILAVLQRGTSLSRPQLQQLVPALEPRQIDNTLQYLRRAGKVTQTPAGWQLAA